MTSGATTRRDAASQRLERAERSLDRAEAFLSATASGTPAEARDASAERFRLAQIELDVARADWDLHAVAGQRRVEEGAMTTKTAERADLAVEIEDIRSGLAELQERFHAVMREVRGLPGGDWVWDRVDTYPGLRLDRDMGAGMDADAWLAEVAAFLEDDGEN